VRFHAKLKLQEAVSDKFGASVSDFHQPGPQASSLPGETGKISGNPKLGDFGNGLHQYYLGSSVHSPYRPCLAGDAANQSVVNISTLLSEQWMTSRKNLEFQIGSKFRLKLGRLDLESFES